jgi:hypothetical protein
MRTHCSLRGASLDAGRRARTDLEARERDFATRSNEEEVARARLRNEARSPFCSFCAVREHTHTLR